jgi:hypothetical protein
MNAELRRPRPCLPSVTLSFRPWLERETEQLGPEATRTRGIVGWELDQAKRRRSHLSKIAPLATRELLG